MRLFLGVCVFLICSAHAAYCCYENNIDPTPIVNLSPVDIGPWIYDLDTPPAESMTPPNGASGEDYNDPGNDLEPLIFDEDEQ